MADSSGWITLKQMTQEILFETGRDQGFYKRCMHHVINGVRDLNLFHFDNVKTSKHNVTDLGVISMPTDYVSLIALSMTDGGQMWTLTRNDKLIRTTTDDDLDTDIGEGVAIDTGANRGYKTVGAKNDYYYTIDERNDTFIIRPLPSVTKTFFLQYISSGVDLESGTATRIPQKLKESLKYHVLLSEAIMHDKGDKRLVGLYEDQYEKAVSKLDTLDLPTADELRDMIYETYQNIRR